MHFHLPYLYTSPNQYTMAPPLIMKITAIMLNVLSIHRIMFFVSKCRGSS